MSLSDIYAAISNAIVDQRIDLANLAEQPRQPDLFAGLRTVLGLFQLSSRFPLTDVVLDPLTDRIHLRGSGSFAPIGVANAIEASLTITMPGSDPLFALELRFASAETSLASLVSTFPPFSVFDADRGTVAQQASFLFGVSVGSMLLSGANDGVEALSLSGTLADSEATIQRFSYLLNGWPLAVRGSLVLPASASDIAQLDLRAVDPSKEIRFFSNVLTRVGFQLWSGPDPDAIGKVLGASSLNLIGDLKFDDTSEPATMWLPLAASDQLWRFIVEFPDGTVKIGKSVGALAGLLGLAPSDLSLPEGFEALDPFFLKEFELGLSAFDAPIPDRGAPVLDWQWKQDLAAPSLQSLGVTIGSTIRWPAPIPQVVITDVGMRWVVGSNDSAWFMSGALYGTIVIGDAEKLPNSVLLFSSDARAPIAVDAFALEVTAYVPNFIITAELKQNYALPIGKAFQHFFNADPNIDAELSLTTMSAMADFKSRTFNAEAEVQGNWPSIKINNVTLAMTDLRFTVDVSQSSFDATIDGEIELTTKTSPGPAIIHLGTEYSHASDGNNWSFNGSLAPYNALSVNDLVSNLLGVDPPAGIPQLVIDAMGFRYSTGTGAYSAYGTVSLTWRPTVLGDITIATSASATVNRDSKTAPITGSVSGDFSVNQLNLSLSADIGVANPTYTFKIQFGDPYIELISGWTQTTPKQRLLTAHLGGMTVGGVLEYLVNLAAPTIGYKLDPPWDVLNRIDLSNFELAANLDTSTLTLGYKTSIDLGVIKISNLGVSYTRGQGMSGVNLVLEGNFFGQDYTGPKALAWDVIKDPPPAVPGGGNGTLDIYYLGLGQRVRLTDLKPNSVRQLLDAMEKAMQPVSQDPNAKPAPPPINNGIEFNANSQWLIGLDITVGGVARLGLIFNDPVIYGLSVSLGGPKSGSMSGLNFELLYKKISDNVGMFRIDLTLPVALRTINLGQVSITLGVIVVEIFTNGNFSVDLGFPWKRDFSRSFTLQYLPFIGRGGIYFALLDGTTSTRVPKITNGEFSPVIELGIGLAVGVGTDQVIGPLSIGAYIQVEAVFLGVLGWFNPRNHDQSKAIYFWCQATAAIVGKVYGTVDFKIISVSITLMVEAEAQVTYEVYRPAVFLLAVRVRAEAKIKILFIKISFSFSIGLSFSFTVGSVQQTPWTIASDGGSVNARLAGRSLPALARQPAMRAFHQQRAHLRALHARRRLAMLTSVAQAPYLLEFDPDRVVLPGGKSTLSLHALPAFSIDAMPYSWSGSAPTNGNPQYRCAMVLTADDGVPVDATTPTQRRQRSAALSLQAQNDNDLPADRLCQALLRWAISAVVSPASPDPTLITNGQLQLLATQLQWPEAADQSFSLDNLKRFFAHNLSFEIAGDPGATQVKGGMLVPMPPLLTLGFGPTGQTPSSNNFAQVNKVGSLYEWGVKQYVATFVTRAPAAGDKPHDDPTKYESLASFVFRDYMLMLTRTLVEAAQSQLDKASITLTAPASLSQIAAMFPTTTLDYIVQPGDTVANAAATLGLGVVELEALNPGFAAALAAATPGDPIAVVLGVAPALVAVDNPSATLTPGVYPLGSVPASIRSGDTLSAIATRFGVAAGALGLLDVDSGAAAILQSGATLATPVFKYIPTTAMTTVQVAARFFARLALPAIPEQPWFSETIANWNAATLQGVNSNGELPAGTSLIVPVAFNDSNSLNGTAYTSVPGDTLMRIGNQLALALCYATGTSLPDWATFRDAVISSGGSFALPASQLKLQDGETLAELARRVLLTDASGTPNWPELAPWIANAKILQPLAVLTVAAARVDTHTYTTFSAMADAFDLPLLAIGTALASAPDLIAASANTPQSVTIAHLPVQVIDTLVDSSIAEHLPDIVGRASRQLLAGMRIPSPQYDGNGTASASGPLGSLLTLTGQQFPSVAPSSQPDAPGLEMKLTVNADAQFITLVSSGTTAPGHAANATRNPGLLSERALGLVYFGDPVPELDFLYSASDLASRYPAASFALAPIVQPEALPLASFSPVRYGLDHEIPLQTPIQLAIPGSANAPNSAPSAWRFPESLRALALARSTELFEIELSPPRGSASDEATMVTASTFGALVNFKIRRTDGPTTYELIGANGDDRQVLLDIFQSLGVDGPANAYLLLAPSVQAGDRGGLGVLNPATAFLLRTNLSVASVPETVDSAGLRAEAADPIVDGATLAQAVRFALLLWEGSTVGGTGYFLQLIGADGQGLPGSAFDQDGTTQLSLLVIAASQQQPAPGGRGLLPFNNCALIASAIDASASQLSVVDSNDALGRHIANVAPGHIGYRFTLPNASASANDSAGDPPNVLELFNLSAWRLNGTTFSTSEAAPPLQPLEKPVSTWRTARLHSRLRALGQKPVLEEAPAGPWYYEQVLPIFRFAPASKAAGGPGLPPPENDPYRGIGGATALPSASFAMSFADVQGNATQENTPPGLAQVAVGYTDALRPPLSWPATRIGYSVVGTTSAPGIDIDVRAQAAAVQASLTQPESQTLATANTQVGDLDAVHYQLAQPALEVYALTSLAPSVPDGIALDGAGLQFWQYIAGLRMYSAAAAALRAVRPAALAPITLVEIANQYGVSLGAMATVNGGLNAFALLGSAPVPMPAYVGWAQGDSIVTLLLRAPKGVNLLSAVDALSDPRNAATLPLAPGVLLAIDPRSATVPVIVPTATLSDIANISRTTVQQLLIDNGDNATLFADGAQIELTDATITIGEVVQIRGVDVKVQTPNQVVAAFATLGEHLSVAELAQAIADQHDLLVAGATYSNAHYEVPSPSADDPFETLANNGSGETLARLAALNTGTALFDAGAMVYVGAYSTAPILSPDNEATLDQFAAQYGISSALLLAELARAARPLPAQSIFEVPGLMRPVDANALRVPAHVDSSQTLTENLRRFAASSAAQFVADNLTMPGQLIAGQTIKVEFQGTPYQTQTQADDRLLDVLQRLQQQQSQIGSADLGNAIADQSGLLQPALAQWLPALIAEQSSSLSGSAARYGLSAIEFASANLGVDALIVSNVPIALPSASTITVAADSLNAILGRLNVQDADLSLETLVEAIADLPLLRAQALALLPPQSLTLTVPLPAAFQAPAPFFALSVALRMQRPAALIDPNFEATGPVAQVSSALSPINTGQQIFAGDQGVLALSADIRARFPNLRLATGSVSGESGQLWLVDFDRNGIQSVSIAPDAPGLHGEKWPRFFALRPLYGSLISRPGIVLQIVQTDGTLQPAPQPSDFVGVDVELWALQYLADLDRVLSPPFSTALYGNASAQPAITQMLAAKRKLAQGLFDDKGHVIAGSGIAGALWPVLALQQAVGSDALATARQSISDALGISLVSGYSTGALLQYASNVRSVWQAPSPPAPARLYGAATTPNDPGKPPYSLTAAKTDLATANGQVNFLLTVSDPRQQRNIDLNLGYDITHLECNIRPVDVDPNTSYDASNWLNFAPPLSGAVLPSAITLALGQTLAPLPLRTYPALPSVRSQNAQQSVQDDGSPPVLGDLALWDYQMSYSHEHAAQDEVIIGIRFNQPIVRRNGRFAAAPDLAAALAVYVSAAPALFSLMLPLGDAKATPAALTIAGTAAGSLATLSTSVADAWSQHFMGNGNTANAADTVDSIWLSASLSYQNGDIAAVTLTRIADPDVPDGAPGPAGPNGAWPDLVLTDPNGNAIPLGNGTGDELTRTYVLPDPLPAQPWIELSVTYTKLNIAAYQNARAQLSVVRNRELIPGALTMTSFVFASAPVQAPAAATPLNQWSSTVDISDAGASPTAALGAALQTIFVGTQLPVTITVSYGYELTPPSGGASRGLTTYLPVYLVPNQVWTEQLAAELAKQMDQWHKDNLPNPKGGEWSFGITAHSTLDPSGTLAVLDVERMRYGLG